MYNSFAKYFAKPINAKVTMLVDNYSRSNIENHDNTLIRGIRNGILLPRGNWTIEK